VGDPLRVEHSLASRELGRFRPEVDIRDTSKDSLGHRLCPHVFDLGRLTRGSQNALGFRFGRHRGLGASRRVIPDLGKLRAGPRPSAVGEMSPGDAGRCGHGESTPSAVCLSR
jgi:hypothetical protein